RPYVGWPNSTSHDQNLKGLRGTEVTLVAHTNRQVKEGQLVIGQEKPIAAELIPTDPQAMRFRLLLDKDGTYRIWFTSVEGERNMEPMPYKIEVLPDKPPQVELTKPGTNIELSANGLLPLEGSASDDIGLASLTLRMKLGTGEPLQAKPYRGGKSFRQPDGS